MTGYSWNSHSTPTVVSGRLVRNALRCFVALAAAAASFLVAPSIASAGIGAGAVPTFPGAVTVGQTALPASITISNLNTTPNTADVNTVCNAGDAAPCPAGDPGITLIPSCGLLGTFSVCAPAGADPNVVKVGPTGVGEVGSACAGMVFDITLIDPAFGQLRFTPQAGAHVALVGSDAFCRVNFTFDVLKVPAIDQNAALVGVQTVQIVDNTQRSVSALTGSGRGTSSPMTVNKASPAIATVASPSVRVGGAITDSATVSGLVNPVAGATVMFNLYGPSDTTCTGAPVFTSTVLLTPAGTATSAPYTPTQPGTFRWVATYSGDANNNQAFGPCGEASETVNVTAKANPTIATVASPSVRVGGVITDSATVSGVVSPVAGATVTFSLYGPSDTTCAGVPLFTSVVAFTPGGAATSAPYAPTEPGVFRWIATYSGDANNNPVSGTCAEATEIVNVIPAIGNPTIATLASLSVPVGGTITDSATVSGLVNPVAGATVTFKLYSPLDIKCAGTPVFTSVVALSAGGTATSAPFTPTEPGLYRWIAAYSGDVNNNPVSGTCGEAPETVNVSQADQSSRPGSPTLPATGRGAGTQALIASMFVLGGLSLLRLARRRDIRIVG